MPTQIEGVTSASGLPGTLLASGGAFSAALGLRTVALKGISAHDGQPYMIRRIDGRQVRGMCVGICMHVHTECVTGCMRTVALKGISAHDGQPYMIRRIDGRQVR